MISKMGSPAKPGASSALFNTLLCKEHSLLAKRSGCGLGNMSPWLEMERGLLDLEGDVVLPSRGQSC